MNEPIIKVDNLIKRYKSLIALNNVTFSIYYDEIFGIIGPNGAGKTTLLESIIGLRVPDSGSIQVFGINPQKFTVNHKNKIGVQLQEESLDPNLKVKEAIQLYSSYYKKKCDILNLLKQFKLDEKQNTFFKNLSGGQKQRLFIVLAIMHQPTILFLDEITTGLDPSARKEICNYLINQKKNNKTIILVSHYLDEIETLCDRVMIIKDGQIITIKSPQELINNSNLLSEIYISTDSNEEIKKIENIPCVEKIDIDGNNIHIYGRGKNFSKEVMLFLTKNNISFKNLNYISPKLEDVYLSMIKQDN